MPEINPLDGLQLDELQVVSDLGTAKPRSVNSGMI